MLAPCEGVLTTAVLSIRARRGDASPVHGGAMPAPCMEGRCQPRAWRGAASPVHGALDE